VARWRERRERAAQSAGTQRARAYRAVMAGSAQRQKDFLRESRYEAGIGAACALPARQPVR